MRWNMFRAQYFRSKQIPAALVNNDARGFKRPPLQYRDDLYRRACDAWSGASTTGSCDLIGSLFRLDYLK
jgi:hypothetical protein